MLANRLRTDKVYSLVSSKFKNKVFECLILHGVRSLIVNNSCEYKLEELKSKSRLNKVLFGAIKTVSISYLRVKQVLTHTSFNSKN